MHFQCARRVVGVVFRAAQYGAWDGACSYRRRKLAGPSVLFSWSSGNTDASLGGKYPHWGWQGWVDS